MSDEMSAEPVAWKVRRDSWADGEWYYMETKPTWADAAIPLYSQSPSVVRALAIAECARVGRDLYKGDGSRLNSYDEGWNDGIDAAEQAIRALSSPPSVSEEWVAYRVIKCRGTNVEAGIRATLAALGVTVEGAAK